MGAILFLALKDIRLLMRDKFGLFWLLAFPLLMALFFGSIFSGGSSGRAAMKVAVTDLDNTEASQDFMDQLDSSSALTVLRIPEDSARTMVRKGKAVAFLVLLPGFGDWDNMFGEDTSATMIQGIDPSRKAEAGYLQGIIMQAWFSRLQSMFSNPTQGRDYVSQVQSRLTVDTNLQPEQRKVLQDLLDGLGTFMAEANTGVFTGTGGDSSSSRGFMQGPRIKTEDVMLSESGPRSSWEVTFPQALLWALLGCTAAFAIAIVSERTRGTLLRLRLSPLSRAHILAGKGLACFITAVGVCVLLLAIGKVIFNVRTPDLTALGLAIVCTAICFVGLMMLMSVMGKTEQSVGGAGWAILLIFSMTGGGMVPLMFLPKWMVPVSHLSPVKWGIYALEGAIWRGFTLAEMALPLTVLTLVGLVTFVIGVLVFRKTS